MNDPHNQPHPEELLEAYALDALEEAETLQVESHLESCNHCSLAVAELHHAIGRLGQSLALREPPATLRSRLMDELETLSVQTNPPVTRAIWRLYKTPAARFLVPAAAVVMVALFSVGVVMNLGLSDRTQDLERENATLTAQVAQSTEQDSQLAETVQQLRVTNYWLANPENQSMSLKPPSGTGSSRGILVVTNDGRRAMLLLAGMREPWPSANYHVWLTRQGDKLWAGMVNVDDAGWGTITIQPAESVFRFNKVELTAERVAGAPASGADMVLEGEIATLEASRMLTDQGGPWQ